MKKRISFVLTSGEENKILALRGILKRPESRIMIMALEKLYSDVVGKTSPIDHLEQVVISVLRENTGPKLSRKRQSKHFIGEHPKMRGYDDAMVYDVIENLIDCGRVKEVSWTKRNNGLSLIDDVFE